jgi:hypothetical protein
VENRSLFAEMAVLFALITVLFAILSVYFAESILKQKKHC